MDARKNEILNRFNVSWNQTLERYNDLIDNHEGFGRLKPIRDFIIERMERGENQYFRAGTSMHTLLLSRSVDFGLRPDQKYIRIDTIDLNDYEVTLRDGEKIYRQYRIKHLADPQLMKLIETLRRTLVD